MNNLNALFGARSRRQFKCQMAIADATSLVAVRNDMKLHEIMEGLICSLVSIVQARAQPTEWGNIGRTIAHEIENRLLVTGDTGDEHHARRMV